MVEVTEVTRVSAMRVCGIGCAKVEYAKGKQRCREEIDYLKYEDVVHLDDQPAGKCGFKLCKCQWWLCLKHKCHRALLLAKLADVSLYILSNVNYG